MTSSFLLKMHKLMLKLYVFPLEEIPILICQQFIIEMTSQNFGI